MLLLISERKRLRRLAVRLAAEGVFVTVGAPEAGEYLCRREEIGGVILDCVPGLSRGERLCRALRAEYPDLPILALVSPSEEPELPADEILRDAPPEELFLPVRAFIEDVCHWRFGEMRVYDLTVGNDPGKVIYMGEPMPLSPRAHRILRCLFYRSPHPTPSDLLLSLCYPEGGRSIANLAVQIRSINRLAAAIDPRPLIVNVYREGYRLRDGIL